MSRYLAIYFPVQLVRVFISVFLFSVLSLQAATNNPASWNRGADHSLYVEWDVFNATTDNNPDIGSNNILFGEVAETTGASFLTGGGNIYNATLPGAFLVTITPNNNGPVVGESATVYLQVVSQGVDLNTSSVMLAGEPANSMQLVSSVLMGGFGGARNTYLFSWTTIAQPQWQFNFAATAIHMSLDKIAVDISSVSSAINDADKDGVADDADNCPSSSNTNQLDSDSDGAGDVCDSSPIPVADRDADGLSDTTDPFPDNSAQALQLSGVLNEKLAISGCKTSVRAPTANLHLISENYFIGLSDGLELSGSFRVVKAASKYQLALDEEAKTLLINGLTEWAAQFCDGGIAIKSLSMGKYLMTINKQKNQLTITGQAKLKVLVNKTGKTKKAIYGFKTTLPLTGDLP